MDISTAIKKCTSLPASRLGLKNRGLLLPGYQADIVLFDFNTIVDNATFADPHQFATGISDVLVNGVHTISGGEATQNRGGSVVRLV